MLKLINLFYEKKDAQNTRRGLYDFIRGCKETEDDDGNEETNEQFRADFPILSEHGIMPVTDVNENFSSPINANNEQDGFNGEPIQQPTTANNTDRFWPWNTWLDPDGNPAYYWMGVVTLAALYNQAIIILRLTFTDMAANWSFLFILFDALSDIIYLIDIFVQFRVAYYDDGCLEMDPKKLAMNYRRQNRFLADVISTIPLQYFVNFCIGLLRCLFIRIEFFDFSSIYITMLRLPRLVKTFIVVRFFEVTDSRTSMPNRIRAIKLSLYLWLVIHWIGCIYYILSEFEGRGSNEWVYPNGEEFEPFSRKYIRCLYWSMLILTTIGERPSPCTDLEYVFTGMTFVIGVFVFAAVVGNVGDVISNMNASRQDFQARMDQIKFYMHHRNVPESLQNRVKRWAEYSWTRTQAIDEPHLLQLLPERLRTEIAIQVHLETLKKVKLFEQCEEGLLRELVLKLKPQTFSPNDYICRIGEVGREMFIINHGQVEILVPSSENGVKIVVSRLVRGNYFGEISLLKLDDGHNRRTADVRSVGYSELLCLSRKDLIAALAEYPEAKRILEKIARERMLKTKTVSKFKEKLQQEPLRKDKPRKRRDLFDVVNTPEFKSLVTRQAPEMEDLRKVVADLKELGDKISKLQAEKDRDRIIKSLKRKVRESERDLHEAHTRIGYLESILELCRPAKTPCPCEGEFCVSPLHQNSNSQFKPTQSRMNTSSLEILPTRDNSNSVGRNRPVSSQFPAGIRTLPANYKVPRTQELPTLSLFTLKPCRSASESSQQNEAISDEKSNDLFESAKASNGYLRDTETIDINASQSSRRPIPNISRMESYSSDQSENIPLSGSDDDTDTSSNAVTDDDVLPSPAHESEFFVDVAPNPAFAKSNGLTVLNQGDKRKSFTVKIKQTLV